MKAVNTLESLGLRAQLELSECNAWPLQWVPYVNVLVLGVGLFLLSSRWICPPNLQVDSPQIKPLWSYQHALPIEEVCMIDAQEHILFRHKLYEFSQLEQVFEASPLPCSLLLRMDKNLPLQKVLQVLSTAKNKGISSLQIAVEPEE